MRGVLRRDEETEEKEMMRPRESRVRFAARRPITRRVGAASFVLGFAASAAMLLVISAAPTPAQTGAEYPGTLPDTSIAPAPGGGSGGGVSAPASGGGGKTSTVEVPEGGEEAAPEESPAPKKTVHPRHHTTTHHAIKAAKSTPADVEDAKGKLKLKEDSWAYSRPSKSAKRIEQVRAGKFLNVTGITSSYLRVQLKSGTTAYVPASAVDLTRPTDKIFQLTSDAPVLSQPSHYGKKISEVHKGHNVHVVGLSLNYMKIRMRDGVEGFIPMTALE
jgi:hypothetical protein